MTHTQPQASQPQASQPQPINSEHYRQMLVRDGERRFQEWHHQFLRYQRQYLHDMAAARQSTPHPSSAPAD